MIKKNLLLLLLLSSLTIIYAQNNGLDKSSTGNEKLLSNEEFFKKSEFIFEGRLVEGSKISFDAFGKSNPNDIYTTFKVLVLNVFKGDQNLTNDTVRITIHGGAISVKDENGYFQIINSLDGSHYNNDDNGLNLSSFFSSVLFCVGSCYPNNGNIIYENTKSFTYLQNKDSASIKFGCYGWTEKYEGKIMGLNNLLFETRDELYNYMSKFDGITIPYNNILKTKKEINEFMLLQSKLVEVAKKNSREKGSNANNN